jgi:two-component system, NtrC family, sensor kinase
MGRGPKPAKSKEAKPSVARKSPKNEGSRVHDLEKRLAEAVEQLQTRDRELVEALEQQTATGEILRVISSSPTDEKPVFDAIARSSVRLCGAAFSVVAILDADGMLHLVASEHVGPEGRRSLAAAYPMRPNRGQLAGRAILDRAVVHVADVTLDTEYVGATLGNRATLSVPMLRTATPIGTITIGRFEPVPFTDQQIELLKTFADQAVIAIENVRLFKELQEKNQALTQAHAQVSEALERQTATSEILRVISSSPTDAQPVFEAIARNAARLCDASRSSVNLLEGDWIRFVARCNLPEGWTQIHVADAPNATRVIRDGVIFHVADAETDTRVTPEALSRMRALGSRSFLMVPLHQEITPIGSIVVYRSEAGSFSDQQIALLKTFADQAVIAIENVRLFKELETRNADLTDALSRQTATSEILRVISGSPTDVQPVFDTLIRSAVTLCDGLFGGLDRFDGDLIYPVATYNYTPEALAAMHRVFPARPSRSLGVGRAILDRDVVHIPDVELDPEYKVQTLAGTIGFRSGLFVPMLRDGDPIGVILVGRAEPGPFSDNQIALLKTFADQAVIAIENVRLFKELEAANRELAAASQHKSEFLANMSHELRTPLNAIIGFSEVLAEKMFGELNEKQEEYSKDIHASGQHLLSLINDILDLSKIEAGRMELELSDFHLPTALDSALTLIRERAGRRGIALHLSVDERLGQIQADERKVRQVVLNLLSNAIKFTSEGGRIEVAAVAKDGLVEIAVSDTGVGIAPEDQEAVFEEFRQVGTTDKKIEGTGLGLTLCRKFVELHGGRIWVKSQVGMGSTFTFTIAVHPEK